MKDRIRISAGLLACFCTNEEYGHLTIKDGKVVVRKDRAFNDARRPVNAGANTIRILRHAPWANPVRYDLDVPGYWPTLREYLAILHQPTQQIVPSGDGADIIFEVFDGCGKIGDANQTTLDKEWIYKDHKEARGVLRQVFQNIGGIPYVKISAGNELDHEAAIEFHDKVIFPVFQEYGRIPFAYGTTRAPQWPWLDTIKKHAGEIWPNESKIIFRQIHKCCDVDSERFKWFIENWANYPIRTFISDDGCHPRSTPSQLAAKMRYLLEKTDCEFPNPADTKLRYGIERMADENAELAIKEASQEYHRKFGAYPVNFGQYLNDWVDPTPPTPPSPPTPPPVPPTPPTPVEPWWKRLLPWLFGKHSLWWKLWHG